MTAGATGTQLTCSRSIRSSVSSASSLVTEHQRRTGQQHLTEYRVETVDVEHRQHAEHDVTFPHGWRSRCSQLCSMLASRARWLSIAARGVPLVPEV